MDEKAKFFAGLLNVFSYPAIALGGVY